MNIRKESPIAHTIRYDLRRGPTPAAIEESKRLFGENTLTKKKRPVFFRQSLGNFNDPIIKILLGALLINILVTLGRVNFLECGGILAAILIATLVSTLSEHASGQAFESLSGEMDNVRLTARRGGEIVHIRLSEIVTGDVLLLTSGDIVPADGILVAGQLSVDQSPLTGESEEKKKHFHEAFAKNTAGTLSPGNITWSADDPCQLFRGSRVSEGDGEFLVLRVGDATFYGGVAADVQKSDRPSPLKERLAALAKSVSFLGYIAAAAIAFAYLFNVFVIDSGMDAALALAKIKDLSFSLPQLIRALTMAISVLVVAVPEGLPMMITVVLSSNMKRMLSEGVLVRRLVGIETAGNLNILFTDKTGTLTEGRMQITNVVTPDGEFDTPATLSKAPALKTALLAAHTACRAPGRGNATDRATDAFFGKKGLSGVSVRGRVPFTSQRRYSSGWVQIDGQYKTYVRGAPETLLPTLTAYIGKDGRIRPLTPAHLARLRARWQSLAATSHRVIAAVEFEEENKTEAGAFSNGTLIALLAIRDRVRGEVPAAVKTAREAGIQTVMITGDNPLTAEAIARECGILCADGPHRVLTGDAIATMSDTELSRILPEIAVIARALPSDKSRLVHLSQKLGLVVGMTGDGINDTPALKAADVGFAMGSGTDAAKEAGDIVITDDRFSSIMKAVLFGRTIFLSIRKFIVFQLTMNLCALGVSLIGPFIGVETPVTVIQMLWVNIIMDTLGALAFAGEPSLKEYMKHPPKKRTEPLLSSVMIQSILLTGGYTLALCLWFLKSPFMHSVFYRGDETYYLTVFFALFIFCGIFNSFSARTERLNLLSHLSKNKPFLRIMPAVAVVQLMIIFFGGEMFRCVPLTAREILITALIASTVIPADFLRRILLKKRK